MYHLLKKYKKPLHQLKKYKKTIAPAYLVLYPKTLFASLIFHNHIQQLLTSTTKLLYNAKLESQHYAQETKHFTNPK